jgi:redox-sensing transcriptional repressor
MQKGQIPDIIVGRLPHYLRSLQRMARENRHVTSSQELGERLRISAAQIRKDLSQFGEFGKQGTGYQIDFLTKQLKKILNIEHDWDIVIVGAGDIGEALARYKGFIDRGFHVRYIFDVDPQKIGTKIGDYFVMDPKDLSETVQAAQIKIAMLAVPISQAQAVADNLIKAGVRAILSYAPISLIVPSGIQVQYIDPSIHLQRMTYYLEQETKA